MRKSSLFLGILLFSIAGCSPSSRDPNPKPTESTSLLLYSGPLFGFRRFTVTGIAFLGDQLFAGSERGLYEVIDGKMVKRFNWMPESDVVENPFYDNVNNCLWFEHTGLRTLVRFDGDKWYFVQLPNAERSREDVLTGFGMFNSRDSLYVYSPRGLWRWDETAGWRFQFINGLNCAGERPGEQKECFLMAGARGNELITVIRHGASSTSVLLPEDPNSIQYDQICMLINDTCIDLPNPQRKSFFVKQLVSGKAKAYILTYQNELFSVGASGLEQLPSPGNLEEVLQTDSQTLLATTTNGEILEFDGEWSHLTARPLVPDSSRKNAYIAERNGKVAYAISGYELTIPGDCSIRGESALWIIQRDQSQCVR